MIAYTASRGPAMYYDLYYAKWGNPMMSRVRCWVCGEAVSLTSNDAGITLVK